MASKNFSIPPLSRSMSRIPTRKSPTAPVSSRTPPDVPMATPKRLPMSPRASPKTIPTISTTANKPLKVALNRSRARSLGLRVSVKFLNPPVISLSRSAVIGGKISRKASPAFWKNGMIAWTAFLTPSIRSVRPPRSFQPWRSSLRELPQLLTISLMKSETPVRSSLASSKSPIRISHVLVQPD